MTIRVCLSRMSTRSASSQALHPCSADGIVAARYSACACQKQYSTCSCRCDRCHRHGHLRWHRHGRGSAGSGVRRRRRLLSCCLQLMRPCSSWACRRPWTVSLQAARTACSCGEALHVLGRCTVRDRPGLGWPWDGFVGRQERVPDVSIGTT